MRILFCDDDILVVKLLQDNVKEYFETQNLPQPEYASYTSGEALLANEQRADIVFLDIEMPGLSGIDVSTKLMEMNPRVKVIIVTSYQDYLDEAMRIHVFRYLSKPINKNRLFSNLKDALYQYSIDTVPIPIETKDGIIVCTADDIICFEGTQRETKVYTTDGEYHSIKGINYWQENLNLPSFYSSYRSFLVNMKYVISFDKQLINLKYKDLIIHAYLARRKYIDFKKKYLLYLESTR